jgi:uncharacterized protein YkwD
MKGAARRRTAAFLVLGALAIGARSPPARAAATADDLDPWRRDLLAALGQRRAELGLPAVTPSATLDAAAQEHAEEMAAGGWFGFTSPAGTSVEGRLEAAGYGAELVAAKVYRAPLAELAATLAERWWKEAGASRQSVFHAGVREVGVGVAVTGGERFFVFVLASAPAAGAVPPSLGADLAARRAAFLDAANALRAEHGLGRLRADAALDRAAQEHAVALLTALRAGQPPSTVADLASRLHSGLGGNPAIMAVGKANAGGSAGYSQKTPGREGSKIGSAALAQAVVVDAMSAAQAVETAVERSLADLLAPGYARLGVGVAVSMEGAAPHVLWVACLTRR